MTASRFGAGAILLGTLCILSACVGHTPRTPPATSAPPSLTAPYAAAARNGARVYRLDPTNSAVRVLVDKAGPLSGLGHRHVITVGGLRGFAVTGPNGKGEADLRFPVTDLVVDPRAAASIYPDFSPPSREDVTGTRRHMLGPVLDSSRYPRVSLHLQGSIAPSAPPLKAAIALHGVRRSMEIGGKFSEQGSRLTAEGEFSLSQSDFNITPYSVMMGALRVKDSLRIRYHLTFKAWCPAPSPAKVSTC